MATVNLGKIKFKWRGTYSGGTAYTPDDVVYYVDGSVGSSYICVAATTGNAPSSGGSLHGSWNYMAKGQSTSPTTTHGDIIFRGASADQRLAAGTSGQYLKTLGSGSDPQWGTVTSGVLKVSRYHYLGTQSHTSNNWGSTALQVTHTPVLADSNYWINAYISIGHNDHDALAVFNIRETLSDSSTNIFPDPSNYTGNNARTGYMSAAHSFGSDSNADNHYVSQSNCSGIWTPGTASSSDKNFRVYIRCHQGGNQVTINGRGHDYNSHTMTASSYIEVWELANSVY
jgi:hypothetical protein